MPESGWSLQHKTNDHRSPHVKKLTSKYLELAAPITKESKEGMSHKLHAGRVQTAGQTY